MCNVSSCATTVPVTPQVMSSDGEGYSDDSLQGILNDTDSDVSDYSHLDAPNESLYMIGGVCVAMFFVGVIIVLLAVTISKLRKREEHSNSVHPVGEPATTVVLQATATVTPNGTAAVVPPPPPPANNNSAAVVVAQNNDPLAYRGMFLWQFPPPPPQTQYLYNNEQNNIVQKAVAERPGFVRGFRKNLGGRWRRLVKRKAPADVYTIPAELKPQLKQIYVY
ncbi:uncharacterized protein LOC132701812 isoform X2 [Cylas formicarius]|uniref:uncharacterized protein LOC132701812 isoform X2 n=1 Tax=Cylas formicarius TaxID=197179 RepID=UPI00295871E9|nr:uncharacterized protein LOC132701812 isoform X2 [Cylas formicarius]